MKASSFEFIHTEHCLRLKYGIIELILAWEEGDYIILKMPNPLGCSDSLILDEMYKWVQMRRELGLFDFEPYQFVVQADGTFHFYFDRGQLFYTARRDVSSRQFKLYITAFACVPKPEVKPLDTEALMRILL